METLFEQVQNGQIWPLTGGIHPPSHKEVTSATPIGQLPLPKLLIIPLKQHIGVAGKLLVKVGEHVLKGQPLTEPVKGLSLPVHAPTSGQISQIAEHPIAHPSALSEPCLFLEPDGQDSWIERNPNPHYTSETPEYLVNKLKMAGISGLGGAGFPAFIKSASLRKINYLIINATECEPYISADDALIQQNAEAIVQGIDVISTIVNPELILIGIEDDKPRAIAALKQACDHRNDINIRVFPSKYPSGGEKQLIQILTGQQVPAGGLPIDIGILVHNIGTLHAIYKAVICDEPVISRIVTVTGGALKSPQNLDVMIGTPVKALLEYCDFNPSKNQRVIMGGPMMGFTLTSTDIPVVKITNCVLAPGPNELPSAEDESECIRCSACADVCPVKLLPQQLFWYSKAKDYDTAQKYNLKDCIECGACAFVCPSEIPLVQYYRVAKAEVKAQNIEKQQAEKAKLRFEARKERLARDAKEREEKQRLAAEKRKAALAKSGGKNAVADALARVKAKKAAQATGTQETPAETATSDDKPLSGAARAIAKAKERKRLLAEKEAGASESTTQPEVATSASVDEKPLSPAARAVAKAKERKRLLAEKEPQASEPEAQTNTSVDEKPLSPAARAVAKAKERKRLLAEKEAQASEPEAQTSISVDEKPLSPAARAVAKAKERKRRLAEKNAEPVAEQQTTAKINQTDNSKDE